MLTKYRHAFLVGLQSSLIYRWNFSARALFSLFHLAFIVTYWTASYSSQTSINGFTLGATITYFVTVFALQFLISAFNEDYQISEEIRNGLINQFLLKPINYFAYRFTIFLSARVVTGAVVVLPMILIWPFLGEYLAWPTDVWRLALGLPAMILSAIIQFTIAYCFGLLTFWFLEIQAFVILSMAIETVLGGQVFPLDLLQKDYPLAFEISQYLPYYYQMYFPAAILSGRIELAQVQHGLVVQLVWVIALLGLAQLLWTRGLRRHTAVGG